MRTKTKTKKTYPLLVGGLAQVVYLLVLPSSMVFETSFASRKSIPEADTHLQHGKVTYHDGCEDWRGRQCHIHDIIGTVVSRKDLACVVTIYVGKHDDRRL